MRYSCAFVRGGVLSLLATFIISTLHVATLRTQTLALHRGWNSVFLEVTPPETDPSAVFTNLPVQIVAAHFPISSAVQFIKDPGTIPWKKDGWGVWYSSKRADSFLSTLHAVDGNKAYLIYADQDCTWGVAGYVNFDPLRWKNDSYNHVGFGVDAVSPPTFQKFFASSKAHQQMKVFRLENDHWTLVQDPITETLHSGEAYWVFCKGSSDFQGPLNVRLPAGTGVLFADSALTCTVVFRNDSSDPLKVSFESVAPALPLTYVVRAIGDAAMVDVPLTLPQKLSLPMIESAALSSLKLELRREQLTTASASALLKVTTDAGTEVWIPVSASRSDLSNNP